MNRKGPYTKAFTLIELMLVVAIIGLLAAIAIPRFANLVIKAREASVRGNLGAVRSALSIYYADNEGAYPSQPDGLIGKYIDALPAVTHPSRSDIHLSGRGVQMVVVSDAVWTTFSPAAWYFDRDASSHLNGVVAINCTHTDSNGTTWSLW